MKKFIGFKEALQLVMMNVPVCDTEPLSLNYITGRILAEDVNATVNNPSLDVSLKDGYAVRSADLDNAGKSISIKLHLIGSVSAGGLSNIEISHGQTIRITTGAPIPKGADAVLAEEFSEKSGDDIVCLNIAEPGRNILRKGSDIRIGDIIARKGEKISPALLGLMASSGIGEVLVYKIPRVAVIATGDEIVSPGKPLPEGKLFASNLSEICSWLSYFGFPWQANLVKDDEAEIEKTIQGQISEVDAFVTSGGMWGSEKDLLLKVLENLKWQGIFHRVKLGPGKAAGFGLLNNKPFLSLPGGPPSNEMAFLQLALPGLMVMRGEGYPVFPTVYAQLTENVSGESDWAKYIHAELYKKGTAYFVRPLMEKSRLKSMAIKNALIAIPEGQEKLNTGDYISVQVLSNLKEISSI